MFASSDLSGLFLKLSLLHPNSSAHCQSSSGEVLFLCLRKKQLIQFVQLWPVLW